MLSNLFCRRIEFTHRRTWSTLRVYVEIFVAAPVGYMEDDLMEIGLKSIFRAISSLENWIMI